MIEESIHVVFIIPCLLLVLMICEKIDKLNLDDKIDNEVHKEDKSNDFENLDSHHQPSNLSLPKEWKFVKDHPLDQIIGEPSNRVQIRSSLRNISNLVFLSQTEPKNVDEVLNDEFWTQAMQEELN